MAVLWLSPYIYGAYFSMNDEDSEINIQPTTVGEGGLLCAQLVS
jgi:hypothetical protein